MLHFITIKTSENYIEYKVLNKFDKLINYMINIIEKQYGNYNCYSYEKCGTIYDGINKLKWICMDYGIHTQKYLLNRWKEMFEDQNFEEFTNEFCEDLKIGDKIKPIILNQLEQINYLLTTKNETKWSDLDPNKIYKQKLLTDTKF